MPCDLHLFMVYANWLPGCRDQFEHWYDAHVQDILRVPGFVSAQRFEARSLPGRTEPIEHRHLVVYEIEGDPAAALAALRPAVAAGKLQQPDPALMQMPLLSCMYSALGSKQLA